MVNQDECLEKDLIITKNLDNNLDFYCARYNIPETFECCDTLYINQHYSIFFDTSEKRKFFLQDESINFHLVLVDGSITCTFSYNLNEISSS